MLQWVELSIPSNAQCLRLFRRVSPYFYISGNMVCAGRGNNLVYSSCHGDSGGPMTVRRSDGRFELVGIVSWGYRCCMI